MTRDYKAGWIARGAKSAVYLEGDLLQEAERYARRLGVSRRILVRETLWRHLADTTQELARLQVAELKEVANGR